jgi:large subunit ribosomal protein L6
MSRIGKKQIKIPEGVEIKVESGRVAVKGPKGELEKEFPKNLDIQIQDGSVSITPAEGGDKNSEIWGLGRALLATMIKGVSDGFEKVLEFSGVGFKAQVHQLADGENLELNLGFTNPVVIKAPKGVAFQVEKNLIKVIGADKEAVGHVAALIRASRPPEPYKGTGIKYKDEIIIKKAGKKAVTTGA